MAECAEKSPDLEIVPLWESLPIAVEALGASRAITPEVAAYVASRLTARWASQGDITPSKAGITLLVDFIPARPTLVPFRYENDGPVTSLGNHFREAFEQFLRYLVARPLGKDVRTPDPASIREIAEALDREYGWFSSAEPGKANTVVASLLRTDKQLAGLLFNPNLYPGLETSKPANSPASPAKPPAAAPTTPPPANPPAPPPTSPPQHQEPRADRDPVAAVNPPVVEDAFVLPPPKSFTQRLDNPTIPPASEEKATQTAPNPTPSPEKRPAPAMNKASPVRSPGVRVQVFASRSKEEADTFLKKLQKAGTTPEIETVDLNEKGIWYRIRLRGYESRDAALAAAEKLRTEGLIRDYWIIP
jgi:cell division septation protein DedD